MAVNSTASAMKESLSSSASKRKSKSNAKGAHHRLDRSLDHELGGLGTGVWLVGWLVLALESLAFWQALIGAMVETQMPSIPSGTDRLGKKQKTQAGMMISQLKGAATTAVACLWGISHS